MSHDNNYGLGYMGMLAETLGKANSGGRGGAA